MSAVDPLIPSVDDIFDEAMNGLKRDRPAAFKFFNQGKGVWSHIIAGLRAQCSLELARIAHGAANNRLSLAEKDELIALVASEFDTLANLTPTNAVAEINLVRNSGPRLSGSIPKGTRFKRPATTVAPILGDALFEAMNDTFVPAGVSFVNFPVIAVQAGSAANTPFTTLTTAKPTFVDPLFDPLFVMNDGAFRSAGGSDGATDADIRTYAKAYFQGQYAPTDAAAIAGCYNAGVRHVALADTGTGTTTLWIADESWAAGTLWASLTRQSLYDNGWIGFGSYVDVQPVVNQLINVTANVVVADQSVLFNTAALENSMRLALRDYFDNRPDWFTWKAAALRGVLARIDRKKVLDCLSVVVRDSLGNVLSEPVLGSYNHYMLADNALTVTFTAPT